MSGTQEELPGIQGMLFALERVFIDNEASLRENDFIKVVAEKVLVYLKHPKV